MRSSKPSFLFDFGLSQEDPLSEIHLLTLQPGDKVLSLASAGDMPLSLMSLIDNIKVVAVDISGSQIKLSRLKLLTAVHLEYPQNGGFLGFAEMQPSVRREIYRTKIRPLLPEDDINYWDQHISFLERGIINAGRFERYVKTLKAVASVFIGKDNLDRLINCRTTEEQSEVFDNLIAPRKSLRLLFKIAFHPAVYRKRGLHDQALIHANRSTGERFYSKFRQFCTTGLASENYFLQYFLMGKCRNGEAFPPYLQPANRSRLAANAAVFELTALSFQETLASRGKGFFNKIHLSNLGDWLSEEQFSELIALVRNQCLPGTILCYRFLQKNHLAGPGYEDFNVDHQGSGETELTDRFPFYGILKLIVNG